MNKNGEKGFVLVAAIALAVLYFMLMELILIDSSRALAEAQRFRARTVAATLAENAAELAAQDIVNRGSANVTASDSQGKMSGTLKRTGINFELDGKGTSAGIIRQEARVVVQGRIDPADNSLKIDYTMHTQ